MCFGIYVIRSRDQLVYIYPKIHQKMIAYFENIPYIAAKPEREECRNHCPLLSYDRENKETFKTPYLLSIYSKQQYNKHFLYLCKKN